MAAPTAAQIQAQVLTLTEAIYLRHLAAGDRRLDYMPALDDPLGIVGYLCSHDPLPADIPDALAILRHLRRLADRHELALLYAGRRHNVPLSAMAPAEGVKARQGVDGRIVRLEAAMAERVRRERDERVYRAGLPREGRWLKRERDRIRKVARAVVVAMDGRDWWSQDAADCAEEMEVLLGYPDFSAGEMMGWLGALARDWGRSPAAPDIPALADALALAGEWDANR